MIGIIGAMQIEVDAITKLMDSVEVIEVSGTKFYQGTLANKEVIIMLSGVGKVNAAMNTTKLLLTYPIDYIINIGTAGGLLTTQKVLDIVVSEKVTQHDFDTSLIDGPSGIGLSYDADTNLLATALKVLSDESATVYTGEIVTGDQFIAAPTQLDKIKALFPDAICSEMEAGSVGQVCHAFNKPFIVLRSLSDVAYNDDSHLDFLEYAKAASERSARFVENFILKA